MSKGAEESLPLVGNVLINLLIYVAVLAFLDQTLLWFSERAGMEDFTLTVRQRRPKRNSSSGTLQEDKKKLSQGGREEVLLGFKHPPLPAPSEKKGERERERERERQRERERESSTFKYK